MCVFINIDIICGNVVCVYQHRYYLWKCCVCVFINIDISCGNVVCVCLST